MPSFSKRTTWIGTRILVSTLALAAANAAHAQSYDAGDPVVVSGSVTFDRTGTPNTETYTINSSTAVLDFIPNDTGSGGPINFQFSGTLAQYLGGLGITDFTVLNRILAADPSRAIQLNGTIISRLQASPTTPGGSVWFYSPGGIIVGSTAVIDVGNLLLATGDPTGGSGVIADPNQFTINSVPDSNYAINVQAGAQITASNAGSYIALVAPSIIQSGTVSTNGSAAYVAAEQTTLTFNSGLFNIQTTVGSNANGSTPLVHDGTTRFIDDTGQRRAYLVSVAKNDAITMLIEGSGQLGFDTATGVNIDNGVVVLSGGYDVTDTTYTNLAGSAGALRHDIQITSPANNANLQGQVNPFAASEIRINSLGQIMSFAGDVSMNAGSLASVISGSGGSVDIAGDLDLSTLAYGARDADFAGGNVVVDASLGDISIGGSTSLSSYTDADFLGGIDPAGTVQGGNIVMIADNGNAISMLGNLNVLVEANGADQLLVSQTSAGNAIGGNIILASSGGSAISVGGAANIVSTATGGTVQLGNATAGNATGGTTNIFAFDGDIAIGGDLTVNATGTGGQVNASGTTGAGDGTGGQINITIGSNDLTVGGNLTGNVEGFGGSTAFATSRGGGDGLGGSIVMSLISGGNIAVANNLSLRANGFGSSGVGVSSDGGSAAGGNLLVLAQNGTLDFGTASLTSRATGGSAPGGIIGGAIGGNISLLAQGGTIQSIGDVFANAVSLTGIGSSSTGVISQGGVISIQSDGGNFVVQGLLADVAGSKQFLTGDNDGGDAIGGSVSISALNSGTLDFGSGGITAIANALGGDSNVGDGQAGNAQAGLISVTANSGGAISTGTVQLFSRAIQGNGLANGFAGGNGFGGDITISANGGTIDFGDTLNVDVTGIGGQVTGGAAAGDGRGGSILVNTIAGGAINIANLATFIADGVGSNGSAGGDGGSGIGGTVQVLAQGGAMNFGGNVMLNAFGRGEAGSDNTGVVAQGGTLALQADTGAISIGGDLDMFAQGLGQVAGTGQDGANAVGGSSIASATNGGTLDITGTAVTSATAVAGNANGGVTGQAGDAQGGNAQFVATGSGIINIGQGATASAVGIGGNGLIAGASGGDGAGGTASISQGTGGLVQISVPVGQAVVVTTDGMGGSATGGGGIGGDGTGGDSRFVSNDGSTILTGELFISAQGQGGNSDGIAGGNGTGGLANIGADTGLTRVTGNATIRSAGIGGAGTGTGTTGGSGIGGQSLIGSIGTGAIDLQGAVNFNDNSIGGSAVSGDGGNGTGGFSQIFATAGSVDVGGVLTFNTLGRGGDGLNGGIGTGGLASIFADSAGTINIANQVTMAAVGVGGQADGSGNSGGLGQGGTAEIFANGAINIAGDYQANSGGNGGAGANGADGGDALGGRGSIIANGGVVIFNGAARTRGSTFGGNIISGTGSGGNAQGGLAEMIARNGGNLQILGLGGTGVGDANVATSGFGGDGLYGSGSAGNATGGISNVIAESGGTINIAGLLLATASGLGGQDFFDPSFGYADLGGDGTGGTVNILANGGSIIGTSSLIALANGHGGLGVVQGGAGTGGTVNVQAIDGLLDFSSGTDTAFLSMSGFGGNAVNETDGAGNILRGGGNGGDGIGGNIFLLSGLFGAADGLTGILRIGDIRVSENAATPLGLSGIGGAGAAGAAGQDGGDGGDAVAGVVRIGTNNGLSQFTAGNITAGNQAIGGIGGDGDNGGDGGDAFGRQTSIGTFNQLGANTGGSMTVGNIAVNGSALAGNGGAGLNGTGGTGGDALVGAPELFTTLASSFLVGYSNPFTFNDAILTMNSTGGDGGIGSSGRAAGGTSAGFGAGIIARQATDGIGGNGQVFGNSLIAQAISTGGLGAGDVRADSNRGFALLSGISGNIFLNSATLTDGGLNPNQDDISSYIQSGNGFVQVTGLVDIDVAGDFGLYGLAGGDIQLDSLNVVAGGTILFDDPRSPGSAVGDVISIDTNATADLGGDFVIGEDIVIGGAFNLTAGGSISTLNITAGTGINLQSGGTITTGNLLSNGDVNIAGIADEVLGLSASILTGNITSQAGLINIVTNIGDITLGNLVSPNGISVNAGNGSSSPVAGGDVVIGTVQGSNLDITGTDNLTIGNVVVTDSLALTFVGAIDTGSLTATNDITMTAGDTITVSGDVASASFTAVSDADLLLGGAVNASTQASFTAAGLASFAGLVDAPNISVTSADIAIGTNGGLGGTDTDDLEINAVAPDQPIIFGGNGSGGGYNLNATEATKLRSRTIRFNAQQVSGAAIANITIDDFTLQGSLAGTSANLLASQLDFSSPGTIRVIGAGLLNNAGLDDRIALFAGQRIEVVTDLGGSLRMRDDMGNPGGTLFLSAPNIAVGTDSLLSQLAANPRFAGRDDIVNGPDGSNLEGGFIEANFLDLAGSNTIIIQNSNSAALRGGFTTGTAGVLISNFGAASGASGGVPVDVVINGRIADGTGGYLTNEATLTGIMIEPGNSLSDFNADSTVNGCLLNGGTCDVFGGTPVTPDTPDDDDSIASDVREIVDDYEPDNSDEEQEDEERAAELTPAATGKKSPIAPSVPVVNTKRLNSSPLISDPITGSGNPNFISRETMADPSPQAGAASEGGQ